MRAHAEVEELLGELQGLTRAELAELVMSRIPTQDVPNFVVLARGLSIEALRFVSARTLLRDEPSEHHCVGAPASIQS
jgi:hypothetical protein